MTHWITYQLYIELEQEVTLNIGSLGEFSFPKGKYVYTGSARRNIQARVCRHLKTSGKKLRWHIDYLLHSRCSIITGFQLFEIPECELNKVTEGRPIISGFGASDCRVGCISHLKYKGQA
jgi:Uri superfamily endonuclease